jgi:DNA polymerase III alpha subunit
LTLIKKIIEIINEKENKNINPLEFIDDIVFNKINDKKTFEIFQK